ncbi:hypothetical protein BT96DRAFT_1027074 [Gymnopus androsaceus JB14]|uniref:Uncharacterized protein n=1 Tax=Gymnopus androsaceus JB14 TaxID=1447944 RepID=A0A6A4GE03_9AGAR|nr:hypothetical protein BT96DRAFT_1027074 [Gymnopus androsaceus JB14]
MTDMATNDLVTPKLFAANLNQLQPPATTDGFQIQDFPNLISSFSVDSDGPLAYDIDLSVKVYCYKTHTDTAQKVSFLLIYSGHCSAYNPNSAFVFTVNSVGQAADIYAQLPKTNDGRKTEDGYVYDIEYVKNFNLSEKAADIENENSFVFTAKYQESFTLVHCKQTGERFDGHGYTEFQIIPEDQETKLENQAIYGLSEFQCDVDPNRHYKFLISMNCFRNDIDGVTMFSPTGQVADISIKF